jgi:ABC-2 type transport system ATP-binding protein
MTSDITPSAIRAIDLVKVFGEVRAVDRVSFELAPGRIYGVLGPNGSGKATHRLLMGLARAAEGRAEVLGVTMPIARSSRASAT